MSGQVEMNNKYSILGNCLVKYGVDNSRLKHLRIYSPHISLIYFFMDA